MTSIDAFILIGGNASRFGGEKASAETGGRKIVERVAEAVLAALPDSKISLVAANDGQSVAALLSLPYIVDRYPGRGPLGGIHAALTDAQSEWILITACDYPFITCELVAKLASCITSDIDVIVPRQENGFLQPLCALYRVTVCRDTLNSMLSDASSTPPVRALIEKVRSRVIDYDELKGLADAANFFFNVNTRDDLDKANSILDAATRSVAE